MVFNKHFIYKHTYICIYSPVSGCMAKDFSLSSKLLFWFKPQLQFMIFYLFLSNGVRTKRMSKNSEWSTF